MFFINHADVQPGYKALRSTVGLLGAASPDARISLLFVIFAPARKLPPPTRCGPRPTLPFFATLLFSSFCTRQSLPVRLPALYRAPALLRILETSWFEAERGSLFRRSLYCRCIYNFIESLQVRRV